VEIIIGGRRAGKTTRALEWLKGAERRKGYPFWDRVLVVHSNDYAQQLRTQLRADAQERGAEDASLYYNLVYSTQEWTGTHMGHGTEPVQVMIDNLDLMLHAFFHNPMGAQIAGFTLNQGEHDNIKLLDGQGGWCSL
jgi:hypothetical protein